MSRLALALVLVALAVGVASVLQRRRPDAPTQRQWAVPQQLDRGDFASPATPWLVAVFTSATCGTCGRVVQAAEPMASDAVVVQELEVHHHGDLHERYRIDAVPTLVVADAEGVVRASYVGPVATGELWSVVADLREQADRVDRGEGTGGTPADVAPT